MTKRLSYLRTWAQGGVKTDPDLDTKHPSFIANRYNNVGWKAEKPPEQWQNFLSNITDEKIKDFIKSGVPIWDATVAYQPGAFVVAGNGVLYVNDTNTVVTGKDPANGAPWQVTADKFKTGLEAKVKEFVDKYNAHLAADNPHKDTIEGIGGVNVGYVDNGFGDPTDARTIVNHKNRTGAVHSETATQLGTLSASAGGVFTGVVNFLAGILVRTDIRQLLQLNQQTGMVELMFSNVGIHVDPNGDAWVSTAGVTSQIVTEGNFTTIQNTVNQLFVLPPPQFSFNLEFSLSDVESVGKWILTANTEPTFENLKGLVIASAGNLVSSNFDFSSNTAITAYIVGSDANKNFAETFDTAMATIGGFSNFLNNLHNGITHIRQLVIYPRLTAYQKTKLATY